MSYLKYRSQAVPLRYNDKNKTSGLYKSNKSELINTGLPQGSNLSPVLFLLYINDLLDAIDEGKVCLFADDVGHAVGGNKIESMSRRAGNGDMLFFK